MEQRPRSKSPRVLFGDIDVTDAATSPSFRTSIYDRPSASLKLELERTPDGVDYMAPVSFVAGEQGAEHSLFLGNVTTAIVDGLVVSVECGGGVILDESKIAGFGSAYMQPQSIFHMIARSAGLTEDRISIGGFDELVRQTFEIVVPLSGIEIDAKVQLGPVALLPATAAMPLLEYLDSADEDTSLGRLLDQFRTARSYALVIVTESAPYTAEEKALSTIDWVLAWLTVRSRFGHFRSPEGVALSFDREQTWAVPARSEAVALRGLGNGARWIRNTSIAATTSDATQQIVQSTVMPTTLPTHLRQALLAAARAATATDTIQRVSAFWEAIEFLVSDADVPKTFTKGERKKLREVLTQELPVGHHPRIERLISMASDIPLLDKLKSLLERERVPFSPADDKLVRSLRNVRNTAVHGKSGIQAPDPEDLEHAVAILSRIILYRLASFSPTA